MDDQQHNEAGPTHAEHVEELRRYYMSRPSDPSWDAAMQRQSAVTNAIIALGGRQTETLERAVGRTLRRIARLTEKLGQQAASMEAERASRDRAYHETQQVSQTLQMAHGILDSLGAPQDCALHERICRLYDSVDARAGQVAQAAVAGITADRDRWKLASQALNWNGHTVARLHSLIGQESPDESLAGAIERLIGQRDKLYEQSREDDKRMQALFAERDKWKAAAERSGWTWAPGAPDPKPPLGVALFDCDDCEQHVPETIVRNGLCVDCQDKRRRAALEELRQAIGTNTHPDVQELRELADAWMAAARLAGWKGEPPAPDDPRLVERPWGASVPACKAMPSDDLPPPPRCRDRVRDSQPCVRDRGHSGWHSDGACSWEREKPSKRRGEGSSVTASEVAFWPKNADGSPMEIPVGEPGAVVVSTDSPPAPTTQPWIALAKAVPPIGEVVEVDRDAEGEHYSRASWHPDNGGVWRFFSTGGAVATKPTDLWRHIGK